MGWGTFISEDGGLVSGLGRDLIVEEDKNMEMNRYGMAVAGLLSVNHRARTNVNVSL